MMQARSIVSKDCGKHVAGKHRECAPEALAACVRVVARHEKKEDLQIKNFQNIQISFYLNKDAS